MKKGLLLLLLSLALVACNRETNEPEEVVVIVAEQPTIIPTATPAGLASSSFQKENPWPTVTPLPEPTTLPTSAPPEPEVDRLNKWLELTLPSGWQWALGPDGVIVAQELSQVPFTPFAQIRRWNGLVTIDAWQASLTNGVEERNSRVSINMAEREWEGVFITEEGVSRSFFAVNQENGLSYSLFIYVPATAGEEPEAAFDREADTLNAVLRSARFLQ